MEEWKDIQGYEGLYQVSNKGRVRSLERDVMQPYREGFRTKHLKEHLLTQQRSNDKYLRVKLNGKYVSVSHIVASAFVSNPNGYTVVHHKDHNPNNNSVENLEWKSKEEHDEKHSKEKCIVVYQYTLDGEFVKVWESTNECGRNGFCQAHVTDCCNGKRKTHKGYIWKYSEN